MDDFRTGRLGRLSIGGTGSILDVDAAFCSTMRSSAGDLAGCNILDFTALADRERCIVLLARLIETGEPLVTTTRLLRGDGSHLWVQSRLSLLSRDVVCVSVEIDDSVTARDRINPAQLLRIARLIYTARRTREKIFSPSLFSDHAWDILLAAYIGEAQGRVVTPADLPGMIGLSPINASRWMRALNADGLLEYEDGDGAARITASFRLSSDGHRRFERFLSDRYEVERSIDAEMALDRR